MCEQRLFTDTLPLKPRKTKIMLSHQKKNVLYLCVKRYYSWGRIPDFKKACF